MAMVHAASRATWCTSTGHEARQCKGAGMKQEEQESENSLLEDF